METGKSNLKNRALIFIALFYFLPALAFSQFSNVQTRAIWVLRDALYEPSGIDSALIYAALNGYDTVFLQVRARGDAMYESGIVPVNERIEPDFDPLAYSLELGHELGLKVHAWVNTYVLWSSAEKPFSSDHLYYTHPEWTEANHFGKMDYRIDFSLPPGPGWEGIYLAPTHPEVNPYLVGVIREILQKYDVDGIHLDYIRYQDDYYGYNPTGRKEFRRLYDIDPMDIARGIISTRFGWTQAEVDSINTLWLDYKMKSVTQLVQSLKSMVDSEFPGVMLSAAVKPDPETAQTRFGQDWETWVNSGLVDFVTPMNYYKNVREFTGVIETIKTTFPGDVWQNNIVMGVATYNQDANSVADKIYLVRMNGFTGISIFSYNSHKNNLDWFIPVVDALGRPFEE